MSLHWTIDHDRRLVTATATGNVGRADMEAYLEAMAAANALSYRKLFDGSASEPTMTADELLMLGSRMRAYHRTGEMGALAIVVATDKLEFMSRVIGILASADRPLKVFQDVRAARRWLKAQPPAGLPSTR